MTEQRKKLIERFDKWLDSKPRKQIISAQCANIAEEYAKEQLLLHNVSQQRELLIDCVNFCDGLDLIENSTVEEQVDSYLLSINCG